MNLILLTASILVNVVVLKRNAVQTEKRTTKLSEKFLQLDLMCLTNKKVKHYVNSARNKVSKLIRAVKYVYDTVGLAHDCTNVYVKT